MSEKPKKTTSNNPKKTPKLVQIAEHDVQTAGPEQRMLQHEEPKLEADDTKQSSTTISISEPGVYARETELHEENKGEEEDEGIPSFMQHRRISWKTMSRPQRLISGFAIGQLIGTALLLILNSLLWTIPIGTSNGQTVGMPAIIFIVALIFFLLAWSFLLTGALHSQLLMRLFVLGTFTGVLFSSPVNILPLMIPVRIGLLVILWVWGLVILLLEHRAKKHGTLLRRSSWGWPWPTFYPVLALLIVYYAIFFGSFLYKGATEHASTLASIYLFSQTITLQMEFVTFFLIPILFLAGVDFAEFGEAITESGITLCKRLYPDSPWPFALLTALVAEALVFLNLPEWKAQIGPYLASIFLRLAVGGVIIMVIGGVIRLACITRWPTLGIERSALAVKKRILVAATFLTAAFGVVIASAVITTFILTQHPVTYADAVNFTVYRNDQQSSYNYGIAYPSDWQILVFDDKDTLTWMTFSGITSYPYSSFSVFRYTLPADPQQITPITDDFQAFLAHNCLYAKPACTLNLQPATTQGSWQVIRFTAERGQTGIAWLRDDHGQRWFLYGYAHPRGFDDAESVFAVMVDSWHANTAATVPDLNNVREEELTNIQQYAIPLLNGVMPLLVALVVGLPLLFMGRRRPGLLTVAGIFLVVLGVLEVVHSFPSLLALSGLHVDQSNFDLPTLLLTVAVGTLLVLLWLGVRRKMTPTITEPIFFLFVLNGGLAFIAFMYWVYDQAIAAGEGNYLHYLVLAALLLAALGWDIFTSGETTNVEGKHFPRHTRLLLFLGYTMLVSTAVLYFSSQKFIPPSNQAVEKFFESETYPQLGLYVLGVPLLISGFILKLNYWWGKDKTATVSEGHLQLPSQLPIEMGHAALPTLTPSHALSVAETTPANHTGKESIVDPSKETAQAKRNEEAKEHTSPNPGETEISKAVSSRKKGTRMKDHEESPPVIVPMNEEHSEPISEVQSPKKTRKDGKHKPTSGGVSEP